MKNEKNYFASASGDYRKFRPQYPPAFFDYLAHIAPGREWAWDCGCGNGQASVALAAHFAKVGASDISPSQIAEAEPRDNIDYRVAPAEEIPAPDGSLDLITVAQAIHWFDHSRFFAEVERTLRPGGILAAWGYQLLYTDTALDAWVEHFHSDIVGAYWPRGRELLDEGYSRIPFPYPREEAPAFFMRQQWDLSQLIGYLNTWSAVKSYQENLGDNPVEAQLDSLSEAWGDPSRELPVYWQLILYIGRKPPG